MAETLIIRLPENPEEDSTFVVVNNTGQLVNSPMAGPLEDATPLIGTRRVVVLVPSSDVLLTQAELPPARGNKLLQALPYALEEQIATDIERMHFAVGPRGDDGRYCAAAVDRETMEAWLTRLHEAGIQPKVVLPESLAIPLGPPQFTTLFIDDSEIVCTQPGESPSTFVDLSLDEVLDFLEIGQDAQAPEDIMVFVGEHEQAKVAATLEHLRRQVASLDIQVLANGALPHLAVQASQNDNLNLLVGDFAPTASLGKHWQPWKLAASLLVALFVVTAAGKLAQGIALKQEEARLSAAIDQAFQQAFPGQRRQADLRRQIRSALGSTEEGDSGSTFLQALELLAGSMRSASNSQIVDISFRGGVMNLKINAPNSVSLEGIADKMSESGQFNVNIAAANPKDDGVEGRLEIKKVGS